MSAFKSYETKIDGVRLIEGTRFRDERGFFEETWNVKEFVDIPGLPHVWAQDNLSRSFAGVLRGLHIQKNSPQGKLVRCVHGSIFDVWVDLRPQSPSFKKWECITLSSEANEAVYIPPGCAHGFFCLSQIALVQYKCSTLYDKESDSGVRWDDADLKIEWPFQMDLTPHVSPKDWNLPSVREYLEGIG